MYGSNLEWTQVQRFGRSMGNAQLLLKHSPQNVRRAKDSYLPKLAFGKRVKHLVSHGTRHGVGYRQAGIATGRKKLTGHVARGLADSDHMLQDDAVQGCGPAEEDRGFSLSHRDKKQAHAAPPFFELGKTLAEMGSVIEQIDLCPP